MYLALMNRNHWRKITMYTLLFPKPVYLEEIWNIYENTYWTNTKELMTEGLIPAWSEKIRPTEISTQSSTEAKGRDACWTEHCQPED